MATNRKRKTQFEAWYQENHLQYDELANACKQVLEKVLRDRKVPFLSVSARGKTIASASNKARSKGYRKPKQEMTDLAGIRVVTYTETEVEKACEIIKELFCVDAKNSGDKTSKLQKDKVGYRSFHFVCTMTEERAKLPDYNKFSGKYFEIQVRTVLQHAWAEIEHSRRYKFNDVLPSDLTRSLNLTAGLLEVADKQLAQLAGAIDKYKAETREKVRKRNFGVSLNTLSVQALLRSVKWPQGFKIIPDASHEDWATALNECKGFEVRTLKGLRSLITKEFFNAMEKCIAKGFDSLTEVTLVRRILGFSDFKKFQTVTALKVLTRDGYEFLLCKYTKEEIEQMVKDAGWKYSPVLLSRIVQSEYIEDYGPPDDDGPDDYYPPDDDNEGPPDDDNEGPPDDDNEGPPDDDNEGPPDDDNEGPPDDDNEGPPDDDGPPNNEPPANAESKA